MGSWPERIRQEQLAEEEAKRRKARETAERTAAKKTLDKSRIDKLHLVEANLNILPLLVDLNKQVWGGLGNFEATHGIEWWNQSIYWDQISLIFRFKRYSAVTEPVTESRFGRYKETYPIGGDSRGGEGGGSPSYSHEVSKFGSHTEVIGTTVVGVEEKQDSTSLVIKTELHPTDYKYVNVSLKTYGLDYHNHCWLTNRFPGTDAWFRDKGEGWGFRFDSNRPLAVTEASEVLTAILTKDYRERSRDGKLPPQLAETERRNLEIIRGEIGHVKPINP